MSSSSAAVRYRSTTNACKLCTPLGACLAFSGIEGAVPFLHGSQGCSTYIRRYLISHFSEPMDIASSSFGESATVFGGGENLKLGLDNVTAKYAPQLIGVATTGLTETIGDDVPRYVREYTLERGTEGGPHIVSVSTPSYAGTHAEGFHAAVRAVVAALAEGGETGDHVNLLPGLLSPADLRYLKAAAAAFGLPEVMLPDYSQTLDGPSVAEYHKIPEGGTPIGGIQSMGCARATLEMQFVGEGEATAGELLKTAFGVPNYQVGLPIGIRQTDRLFAALEEISGRPTPHDYQLERGRAIDAYVDGHKYVFGKRAIVYGEEDLVIGLTSLLAEIGVEPVLCASGGESGHFAERIAAVAPELPSNPQIAEGADFYEIAQAAEELRPDLLIGHSKGYGIARKLEAPLIRVGFPIHDRLGGQQLLHVGYAGAHELFLRIANAVIEHKQGSSSVGYSYM